MGDEAMLRRKNSGFSLVEFMVAIAIGLFLLAGLTGIFVNSSQSQAEIQKSGQQIENGRYAMQVLSDDLRHAGFYGVFSSLPTAGAAKPDPCQIPTAATAATYLSTVAFPVQGYWPTAPAGNFSSTAYPNDPTSTWTCANYGLTNANLLGGSEIVVVRRAATETLITPPATSATAVLNEVYIQGTVASAEIQLGNGGTINNTQRANGTAASVAPALQQRDGTASAIRKYMVHVYFVAPCSNPTGASVGGNATCKATDDNGSPIPTLKRLELVSVGGALVWQVVPLAEGVAALRLEYGKDYFPAAANTNTGLIGDGSPESYTDQPTDADLPNIVAMKVYILGQNTLPTGGYTDSKTYSLGLAGTYAPGGHYKHQVFSQQVRLEDPSGRRENP